MDIIQRMREEHRRISKVLGVIDRELQAFDQGESADLALLQDAMAYMADYPDQVHHPKEELVFQRLQEIDPSSHGALAQLQRDHEQFDELTQQFAETLAEVVLEAAMMPRDEVVKQGRNYVNTNFEHMALEEKEIFPRISALFTAEDWSRLSKQLPEKQDPLFDEQLKPYKALFDSITQTA